MAALLDKDIVGKPSFSELSTETVRDILAYLPIRELLDNARLVSKSWNKNAASICRSKHVKCHTKRIFRKPHKLSICDIFTDIENLPWSSLNLKMYNTKICKNVMPPPSSLQARDNSNLSVVIAKTFGSKIECLKIRAMTSEYMNLVEVLRLCPNLRKLEIIIEAETSHVDRVETPFSFPSDGDIVLRRLHIFKYSANFDSHNVDLLEFILLKTRANFSLVRLPTADEYSTETDFERIVQIILTSSVKSLELGLLYDVKGTLGWELLSRQRYLPIHKLKISASGEVEHNHFRLLEKFLINNGSEITTLGLVNFTASSGVEKNRQLRIPTLPRLKSLMLLRHNVNLNDLAANLEQFTQFQPFVPSQFPVLEHVTDELTAKQEGLRVFESNLLSAERFLQVNVLQTSNYKRSDGYGLGTADLFVNLSKLKVTISDSRLLEDIFQNMTCLVELEVYLDGTPGADAVICQSLESPPQCRGLKRLHVEVVESLADHKLRDPGAVVLNLLHPLHLSICNAELSEHCVRLLRRRHHQFELL